MPPGESDEAAWPSIWKRHPTRTCRPRARGSGSTPTSADAPAECSSWGAVAAGTVSTADRGFQPTASDLDAETLAELSRRFPERGSTSGQPTQGAALRRQRLRHGLPQWPVGPRDDAFILDLYREQARVASRYAVILVHNALNETSIIAFGGVPRRRTLRYSLLHPRRGG